MYLLDLASSSFLRILAMRNSDVKAENFAGTTRPTSLFLFPVTLAESLFSAFASIKFFNERDSSIWEHIQQASLFGLILCKHQLR